MRALIYNAMTYILILRELWCMSLATRGSCIYRFLIFLQYSRALKGPHMGPAQPPRRPPRLRADAGRGGGLAGWPSRAPYEAPYEALYGPPYGAPYWALYGIPYGAHMGPLCPETLPTNYVKNQLKIT